MLKNRLLWIPFLAVLCACGTGLQTIGPLDSEPLPPAPSRAELEQLFQATPAVAQARPAPSSITDVSIVRDMNGARLVRAGKDLTPSYPEIGSFEISSERKEIAFSARRKDNFDIGLVSIDGSPVNWIPEDPADEVQPRWAQRGNKVAYFVRNRGGDFVRTVHIPTAFQMLTEVPFGVARELAWDAAGERYALSSESAAAGPRTEIMKYDGSDRRLVAPPAVRLDLTVTPFAGGLLLRPPSSAYGEKLPLIVWETSKLNAWDGHRGRLLGGVRAASVVAEEITPELWTEIQATPWVDPAKIYLVTESAVRAGGAPPNVLVIAGNGSVPSGRYRRVMNLISVEPAVVKSFAARFIAEQLKGTSPRVHQR